jgi:hypothetical protein
MLQFLLTVIAAFSNQIHHDVFTKQPGDAFIGYRNVTVLKSDLNLFLLNVVMTQPDTHNSYLRKFNHLVAYLSGRSSAGDASSIGDIRKKLCMVVTSLMWAEQILRLLWPTTFNYYAYVARRNIDALRLETAHIDRVAMSAALGDHETIEELLRSSDDPTALSPFGNCLTNAVKLGHAKATRVIVDHLKKTRRDVKTNSEIYGAVDQGYLPLESLESGIKRRDTNIITILVDYLETTCGPPVRKMAHNRLLECAIHTGKAEIVKSVLDMEFKLSTRVPRELFKYACDLGHAEVAVSLLGDGLIRKDKVWEHTTPLIVSVQSGNLRVTQAVLNAGVEKDSIVYRGIHVMSALEIALSRKNTSMVQLLLNNSVKLPPLCDWPRKEEFYIMLRNEKLKRGTKEFPDFKAFRKMKLRRS